MVSLRCKEGREREGESAWSSISLYRVLLMLYSSKISSLCYSFLYGSSGLVMVLAVLTKVRLNLPVDR